ncbi:hypothetical protein F7018_05295 [Tenacibaculum aiptasiae]|uniref:PsbP C-terminal domain-containing protein n=1 Tax=Tenacibaculum aiptasiae TaxID=426481 RepID=A0A7J5AQ28_9FLAO|nr:hypothetical protein [Tenacibaculum aiptasiae]KAB1159725.1 hypothetical protein F7018_05295 [Tenacibaculum aiptasiae]
MSKKRSELIGKLIMLILFVSCSKNEVRLKELASYPVKFAKQKVNHPSNDFSIFIPKSWKWKVEDYNNENIILGIDAISNPDKDGFTDVIAIQKIKSLGKNKSLESEFKHYFNLIKNNSKGQKIVESGSTEILNQKSYFIHIKSTTDIYGATESISFILNSETEGVFYNLTASASQTKDFKKNMSVMIRSLSTFRKLNNE